MTKTQQWTLRSKPHGAVGQESLKDVFQIVEIELPALKDGQLLVKTVALANNPAQRVWIDASMTPERLYRPPIEVGQKMDSFAVAEVVESRSPLFEKGATVTAMTGWTEYAVLDADAPTCQPARDIPGGRNKTLHLGALGISGFAAYFGLTASSLATKDDIVIISGASGISGSMAVQIAKKIIGCARVVGIAGTAAQCKWVESLGAEICLDYKSPSFRDDLRRATEGPNAPTVFQDYVGGSILEAVIPHLATYARICATGSVSTYNTETPFRTPNNWYEIIAQRLTVRGFNVLDYASMFAEASVVFQDAVGKGLLDVESSECVVDATFGEVPSVWLRQYSGGKRGKLITWLT